MKRKPKAGEEQEMSETLGWTLISIFMYIAGTLKSNNELEDFHRGGYNKGFADAVSLAKRGLFDWQKVKP